MSRWQLLIKSLVFYRRSFAGVILGMALTCAIVIGALAVGDSVKASLEKLSGERLGQIEHAMTPRDRFVREALVEELHQNLGVPVAGLIQTNGIISIPNDDRQYSGINLYGVRNSFWPLGPQAKRPTKPLEGAYVNAQLAGRLGLAPGDTLVIRMEKPSLLPRDATVNAVEDVQISVRVTIDAILDETQFGNFNLQVNQLPPDNIFLPLELLQENMEQDDRINMLLIGHGPTPVSMEMADAAFRQHWQLADAGIDLLDIPHQGAVEIRTGRIFFDPITAKVVSHLGSNPARILTYLVNRLQVGERITPYAMVTALEPGFMADRFPEWITDHQILLNNWTQADLQPKDQAKLEMSFFAVDQAGSLVTRKADFEVAGAIPIEVIDPEMMPSYPGLADSENCRDWDTGIPIDLDEIRVKDEDYWDDYRGTPKALITLAAGMEIWDNRFGNLTAVRYPSDQTDQTALTKAILEELEPQQIGLFFNPVGMMATQATSASMDFSGLFIGFSFFLIIAALLLTALLTTFSLEQRAKESGTLLALGTPFKQIKRQFWREFLVLSLPAGILGGLLGWVFSTGILNGLTTLWRDAVGQWSLGYHFSLRAFVWGTLLGLIIAFAAIWPTLRRFRKMPLTMLLAGEIKPPEITKQRRRPIALIFGIFAILVGIGLVIALGQSSGNQQASVFFGSGALLLAGSLALFKAYLNHWNQRAGGEPSSWGLAFQNLARRSGRSLSIAAMLACGAFLVFSLESYRQDAQVDGDRRDSGTGGFALFAQTSIPLYRDLNTPQHREFYGLDEALFADTAFVPMRLLSGDDASCLNLNRAQQPRVLGLDPQLMAQRQAFKFKVKPDGQHSPWLALNQEVGTEEIPAIGDFNTLTYSLKLGVGDTLDYINEMGDPIKLKIVAALDNSLFQGSLIINEDAFEKNFPSQSGQSWFLIDTQANQAASLVEELEMVLGDQGMRVRSAVDVLNAYNQVQNTYISIFQVLGGLGLILGSLGMGVLVLRNILERRSELAILRAVGFRKRTLRKWLLMEHGFLFLIGLICGMVASAVAILPKMMTASETIPWPTLAAIAMGLLLSGCFWTWLATWSALKGGLVPALRKE